MKKPTRPKLTARNPFVEKTFSVIFGRENPLRRPTKDQMAQLPLKAWSSEHHPMVDTVGSGYYDEEIEESTPAVAEFRANVYDKHRFVEVGDSWMLQDLISVLSAIGVSISSVQIGVSDDGQTLVAFYKKTINTGTQAEFDQYQKAKAEHETRLAAYESGAKLYAVYEAEQKLSKARAAVKGGAK